MIRSYRSLAALVALALVAVACKPNPIPPRLEWTPNDGRALAGATVEVRATKPIAHAKEEFEYSWKLTGACAGAISQDEGWKVAYTIPEDCEGGELKFALESSTRFGSTEHEVVFQVSAVEREELGLQPVRFDTPPETWEFLNRFEGNVVEKEEDRRNERDAYFGTWGFRNGVCRLEAVEDGGSGALRVTFSLPHVNLSACGYFEYFAGPPGKAESTDLTPYESLGFLVRSDTDEPVRLRVELVEFDKYASFDQGVVSQSSVFEADKEWRRYEVDLRQVARTWDIKRTKNVSFRIDVRDGNPGEGILLLDDIVLIRKAE